MLDGGRGRRADGPVAAPDAEGHDPGPARPPGRSPPQGPRPWATSFIYALGNTSWSAAAVSSAYEPPRVFTAMPSPSPSGSSAAFTAVRARAREWRPDGPPLPRDQCSTCTDRRSEKDIRGPVGAGVDPGVGDARGERGQRGAEAGRTSPAPTANATADAECPDGMEELVGWGWTNRKTGRCSGSGRARGSRVLKTTFVTAEATAWASTPCRAARRVLPGKRAITAALPNQSLPLLAEAESRRKKVVMSSPRGGRTRRVPVIRSSFRQPAGRLRSYMLAFDHPTAGPGRYALRQCGNSEGCGGSPRPA